jgi:hypothetical protein
MTEREAMDLTPQIERLSNLVNERGLVSAFSFSHEVAHHSVKAGQVWRAKWDNALSLVMVDSILGGFDHKVRVAPLTLGHDAADDSAFLLPSSSSSLELALTIWTDLATDLSEIVFERWVADMTSSFSSLSAIESAVDRGELRHGLSIRNPSGRRSQERDFLVQVMQLLTDATALISGTGLLPEMLSQAGVTIAVLSARLGAEKSWALKVVRKEAWVSPEQARELGPLLGVAATVILESNPSVPGGLVEAITPLSRSSVLRSIAVSTGKSDSEALISAVQSTWALAARGEKGQPDWGARVDRYFEIASNHVSRP